MIGLEPGSLFAGRYEVIRRIGAGGMGAVYLACDPNDREFKVALKLLYPGTIQSNQARERFRNEITASYRINHNNVVRAYEYFDAEDVQAFAMEYVDGGDLMERMREGAMSPEEACKVLRQIAAALEAVHKAGIIHRDLKPENILLTRKGEVKLSDFGVARLKGGHTLTQAGSMVGTPKYLAPEYVETGECDGRGDIFAVGVMGYELIAGTSPFGKDFKPNNVLDRLTMEIPPLHKVVPGCPIDLSRIIEKAMSMQLSARYQSAAELRADLERFERGEAITVPQQETEEDEDGWYSTAEKNESAEVPGWEASAEPQAEQPLVNSTQGFLSAHLKDIAPVTPERRRIPLFAAVLSLCFLLAALGFTSALLMRRPNPLQGLPAGTYTGMVNGLSGGAPVPLGVWAFQDHALALLGVEGCAAGSLPRDGAYKCGERSFRFTVTSVPPDGASGAVAPADGSAPGTWVIGKAVSQEGGSTAPVAAIPSKDSPASTTQSSATQAKPVSQVVSAAVSQVQISAPAPSSAPEHLTVDTTKLQEIEKRLKDGKISPEEAARALLAMTESKGGDPR